ncbi:MAG: DUF1330 domain-containing protein [Actinobacteria bacterium]|nr:DUF1330 domain-containing protein [Actinomycetota bacterium]
MPAYLIADVREVTDPESFGQYVEKVVPIAESKGGRYLCAGKPAQVLEGEWQPSPTVIEFASVEAALAYYESPEYKEIHPLRDRASRTNVIIVEGV